MAVYIAFFSSRMGQKARFLAELWVLANRRGNLYSWNPQLSRQKMPWGLILEALNQKPEAPHLLIHLTVTRNGLDIIHDPRTVTYDFSSSLPPATLEASMNFSDPVAKLFHFYYSVLLIIHSGLLFFSACSYLLFSFSLPFSSRFFLVLIKAVRLSEWISQQLTLVATDLPKSLAAIYSCGYRRLLSNQLLHRHRSSPLPPLVSYCGGARAKFLLTFSVKGIWTNLPSSRFAFLFPSRFCFVYDYLISGLGAIPTLLLGYNTPFQFFSHWLYRCNRLHS